MSGRTLLVGVGDSSFSQLPCLLSSPLDHHHAKDSSRNNGDDDAPAVVTTKRISQVACGATAAFAAVSTCRRGPNALLEWGTGVYGERLSSPAMMGSPGDEPSAGVAAAAALPPLNHPIPVLPPLLGTTSSPVIRHIACGAHFVVAAFETGGCISWGGGREAARVLGHGGCGSCDMCSSIRNNGSTAVFGKRSPPPPPCTNSSKPDWVAEPLGLGGLKVASLAAGDDHAVAVCANGSAWAWGRGDCGQLGCGPPATTVVAHAAEGAAAVDGRGGGACAPVAVRVPGCGLIGSSSSSSSSLAAAAVGGVGVNLGDTGRPPEAQQRPGAAVVRAAACGRDHSAVLTSDGRVWTFGSGLHGQLGLGSVGEMAWTPTAVDALEGVGTMRKDGSFTGVASVACGAWHTAALSTTGDLYAWGWGRFGALGPSPPRNETPRRRKSSAAAGTAGAAAERCSDNCSGTDTGIKRKFGTTRPTAATGEEGEVRPYPGLVDGVGDLLSDDNDQLVSVSCGARYTLAMTSSKRAFVWGQVAPPNHYGGGGNGHSFGSTSSSSSSSSSRGNRDKGDGKKPSLAFFSSPRELKPAELIRAAKAAVPSATSTGGGETARRYCDGVGVGGGAVVNTTTAGAGGGADFGKHDEDGDSRWRISAVGCGPWYIVFGLEDSGQKGKAGAVGNVSTRGAAGR